MTQTTLFDPYRDDLWEGWEPTARDYADLDALCEEDATEADWAVYFETMYDPD